MESGARSEQRLPKHALAHSFTFSTPPPNPRTTGRKRARTLDDPTGPGEAGDDAKVKGGHSLRKRVRIDYAQMNNEDDSEIPRQATEDPQQITVSGAARPVRAARRKLGAGTDLEEQEDQEEPQQPPPSSVAPKKIRAPKQRTASPPPVPQKRAYTKRKSIAQTVPVENPSPEQQASDTELKDTIEVGAPLAMQFTSSSSNSLPSDTASIVSGQSPSQNGTGQQVVASQTQVHSPLAVKEETQLRGSSLVASDLTEDLTEAIARLSPAKVDVENEHVTGAPRLSPSVDAAAGSNGTELQRAQEIEDNNTTDLASLIQNALQESPDIVSAQQRDFEAAPPASAPQAFDDEPPSIDEYRHNAHSSTHGLSDTVDFSALSATSAPAPGSSQESIDSDTTEILPPEGPGGSYPPHYQTERRPAPPTSRPRLTLRSNPTPVTPQQQSITTDTHDTQKPSLRPRVSLLHFTWSYIARNQSLIQIPYLAWREPCHGKRNYYRRQACAILQSPTCFSSSANVCL